jgi:hypothetical protein
VRVIRLDSLEQFTAINLLLDPGAIGGPVHVPSCAQISLIWGQDDGRTAHNVLYGRFSGPFAGTQTQANGIMTALTTGAAWTAMAAHMPPTSFLAGVSIRNVDVPNQPLVESNVTGAPGTSSGTPLPNEVAICVTLRTANAGRSGRGRIYVPNWATTALGTGNVINAAAVTAVGNWAATITGALNTQGYVFVLGLPERASYTGSTGTVHPHRDATSLVVTSTVVRDNHWDSQRRRGLK